MKLFVGLGNPGRAYAGNRHNIGYMVVDALTREYNFPPFRTRFKGLASETTLAGEKVLVLKPETYMNESGRSVQEAARFYKIPPEHIIVFHDELDLAPGKLRVKTGGGNAGHNGLKSITECIGNNYRRVRIGIGHPGDKDRVHDYVLGDFAKSETAWVETLCLTIAANAELLVKGEDATFQNKVHLAMVAAGLAKEGLF
ncbi:MAG: aminoacyl-tRNA hydrolase [Methylovirgula sp.]